MAYYSLHQHFNKPPAAIKAAVSAAEGKPSRFVDPPRRVRLPASKNVDTPSNPDGYYQ